MIAPAQWDLDLMQTLNFDGGQVLDRIMWFASGHESWIPFYLIVIWMVYRRFGWKYMLAFVVCAFLMLGCVETVSTFFKENLPKLRPSRYPPLEGKLHLVDGYIGGLYGTISAHAGNSTGFAVLTSAIIRRKWFTCMMIFWVLLISYSRIYLGVHYPADLLFGFLTGAGFGSLAYLLYRFVTRKIATCELRQRS